MSSPAAAHQSSFYQQSAMPQARLSALGAAVITEVKMAQMQFAKVQDICWERCCAGMPSGSCSTSGGDASSSSSGLLLDAAEDSCVSHCVAKFYQVAETVALESAAQARLLTDWSTTTKIALTVLGVGGMGGLLYFLFRAADDHLELADADTERSQIGSSGAGSGHQYGRGAGDGMTAGTGGIPGGGFGGGGLLAGTRGSRMM
eukprot:g4356.t1